MASTEPTKLESIKADALEAALPYVDAMKQALQALGKYEDSLTKKYDYGSLDLYTKEEKQKEDDLRNAATAAQKQVFDQMRDVFEKKGIPVADADARNFNPYPEILEQERAITFSPSKDKDVNNRNAEGNGAINDLMATIMLTKAADLSPTKLRAIAAAIPDAEKALAPYAEQLRKTTQQEGDYRDQLDAKYFERYKEDAYRDLARHRKDYKTEEEYQTQVDKVRKLTVSTAPYSEDSAAEQGILRFDSEKYATPAEKQKVDRLQTQATHVMMEAEHVARAAFRKDGITEAPQGKYVPDSLDGVITSMVVDKELPPKSSLAAHDKAAETPLDVIKNKTGLEFHSAEGNAYKGKLVAEVTDDQFDRVKPLIRQGALGKAVAEFDSEGKNRIVIREEDVQTVMKNLDKIVPALQDQDKGPQTAALDESMQKALRQYAEARDIPTGGSAATLPRNADVADRQNTRTV